MLLSCCVSTWAALIAALQQGRLAGAGLDVVGHEPLAPDSPLWAMQNVLLTPPGAAREVVLEFIDDYLAAAERLSGTLPD